jgi:hypothetical protein
MAARERLERLEAREGREGDLPGAKVVERLDERRRGRYRVFVL